MAWACQKQRNGPALSQITSLSCTSVSNEADFTFPTSLCPYWECFSTGQQVPFPVVTPNIPVLTLLKIPAQELGFPSMDKATQLCCTVLVQRIRTDGIQKLAFPCIAISNEHLFSKTLTNRKIMFLTQQLLSEFSHCHCLFLHSAQYLAIIFLPCYQSQCSGWQVRETHLLSI